MPAAYQTGDPRDAGVMPSSWAQYLMPARPVTPTPAPLPVATAPPSGPLIPPEQLPGPPMEALLGYLLQRR